MNLIPQTPNTDTVGTSAAQYANVYALAMTINGTPAAKNNQALDTFGACSDNTDLDATSSRHGLMSKAMFNKLNAIEANATADQTAGEIETAYNSQVPQVSAAEITAGSETAVRRWSPQNLHDFIDAHGDSAGSTSEEIVDAVGSVLQATDTIIPNYNDPADNITWEVKLKSSGLASGSQAEISSDSGGIFVKLGTGGDEAAAGNDNRFLTSDQKAAAAAADSPTSGNPFLTQSALASQLITSDQKAAITGASSPSAGNPFLTTSAGKSIKLDDFATPDDTTDLDATTGRHGLMPKSDKSKLDAIEANADVTDATNVNAAGAVMESDYNANSILAATTDNNPAVLTVSEATIIGRQSGGSIAAISQVSSGEKTAGTETAIRAMSPKDVKDISQLHVSAYPWARITQTASGTLTGGSWVQRVLDTEEVDANGIVGLSAGNITLEAGTYRVVAQAMGYVCDDHYIRLRNTTSADTLAIGMPAASDTAADSNPAYLSGQFTVTAGQTLQLQHYAQVTSATTGQGADTPGSGETFPFAWIEFTKIA